MENIIVVIDDPEYALKMLTPMKNEGTPTQWVLLVCPPRLTRHIGRWVNQASRCLLYTSPSPRDTERSRMPSSA